MARRLFTQEEEDFIKKNVKGLYNEELKNLVNDKFGTNYTTQQIKNLKSRRGWSSELTGHFPKGNVPWNKGKRGYMGPNKTSFKKGQTPMNHRPVGSERICNRDGYILVKIKEPNVWEHKHRVIWEREHGPIPEGHTIIFGDGNKRNFSLDNLICVSRKQLLGLNRHNLIQSDAELTKTAVNIVDLKYKIADVKKRA